MSGRSLAALLALCVVVAGCGGSGAGQHAPAPSRLSDAELAAATVRRQMQAVARGDGEAACALFSPRALQEVLDQVSRRAGDIGCVAAVQQGAAGLSAGVRAALRRPAITRVDVRGARATVRVRLPAALTALAREAGRVRDGIPLRLIDGRWRVDGLAL